MRLSWTDTVDTQEIGSLLHAASAVDGRPELPESGLPGEFRGGRHLLATGEAGEVGAVGYAHLDTTGDSLGNQVVELIVHPAHRRTGIGGALTAEVLAAVDGPVRFWSHGDHPGAAALAARHGLARVRALHRMHAAARDWPQPSWPAGVVPRTFEPGADEDALVAVNARAFSWHPEQGALTAAQLRETEREPWFDPAGFFLATGADSGLLGFHWTKIHPDGAGEVYVVGVDPAAQGGGLGRSLTLAGLAHLRAAGVPEVILYVESDNTAALALYRALGFEVASTDVQYAR